VRVLHVLNHSLPEVDGYSLRSAAILREQRSAGAEPVALTSPRSAADGDVAEEIDGSRYHRTARVAPSGLPLLRELREMARLRRRIEWVAREESVEVIHAHSPPLWGWAARGAARRLGLPFVYEVRALWEDAAVADGRAGIAGPRYQLSRALETRVLRAADVVVVICEALGREVRGRGLPETDVVVVPNGVDAEAFLPRPRDAALAAELGLAFDSTVVGYIGSLRSWEGVGDLIRAAPALARRFPKLSVVIVGDGDMRPQLEAAIHELGVSSLVRLVNAVRATEVQRWYSLLDVVVYPRRQSRLTELTTPLTRKIRKSRRRAPPTRPEIC